MKNVQGNANVLKNGNVEGNVCEERHESVQCNANVEGNTQLHGDAKIQHCDDLAAALVAE